MKSIAVYYRVSTKTQETEIQERELAAWLATLAEAPRVTIFRDKISGNAKRRPNFERMMSLARESKFDTVVTYSIDRFSRQKAAGLQAVLELVQLGVAFHSLTQPFLCTRADTPFQNVLLAAFTEIAQIERETIVRRVRHGLAAAKARGKVLGKAPKLTREMHAEMLAMRERGEGIRALAKHFGVGHSMIHRALSHDIDSQIRYAG